MVVSVAACVKMKEKWVPTVGIALDRFSKFVIFRMY